MYRTIMTAGCLMTLGVTAVAAAQNTVEWNRRFDGVLVTPHETPRDASMSLEDSLNPRSLTIETDRDWMDVQVVFTLETWGRADEWIMDGRLDLGTDVHIHVNGELRHMQRIEPFPHVGMVTDNNEVTGQFTTDPFPIALREGDAIVVELVPAPRSTPEMMKGADDMFDVIYWGYPIFWDRQVSSVAFRPTGEAFDGIVDVDVSLDLLANYTGWIDLSTDVELYVNGAPAQFFADQSLWPDLGAPATAVQFLQCNECNSTCAWDAQGIERGNCLGEGSGECYVQDFVQVTFHGVLAGPGDAVEVVIRPTAGSLPESPMSTGDSMLTMVPAFNPDCPADVTGDGVVDGNDLAAVQGAFCLDTYGQLCPVDVDGNGRVNVLDLMAVLQNWGPCP